ncbi:MAG TPA: 50S ribosomal protein L24 [Fimbriimonadaceae bacterium]|nr:50S ribosomal protein L24 [Fimbriimonadaceae bacterium]HRJ32096.1 50S ribosomal protein L24 [Fimbriimonadaceae bacterium]
MPTKAEVKQLKNPVKLKVRKGDKVVIIRGKDKGKFGFVAAVAPKEQKLIVLQENPENEEMPIPLNAAIKHRKRRTENERSTRLQIPVPMHVSKVMVVDPETNQPTRIGRRVEGDKIVRYAKKSGKTLHDVPQMEKK